MLAYTIQPAHHMNQTILLQLYRSVIEDMRFHKHQLNKLENRAYQIEQAIMDNIMHTSPYDEDRTSVRTNQATAIRRPRTASRRQPSTPEPIPTPPSQSQPQPPPQSFSSTVPESSPFGSAFTYMGTYDVPISALNANNSNTNANTTEPSNNTLSPLATSLARGLLTRALSSSSSNATNATANSTADPSSLLFYFMMENMHIDDAEEPHGIADASRYVTDMVYEEIESPPNTCCPIRMDVFSDETEVSQINKCKHIFCRPELRTWLQSHHTCPLCRTAIDA